MGSNYDPASVQEDLFLKAVWLFFLSNQLEKSNSLTRGRSTWPHDRKTFQAHSYYEEIVRFWSLTAGNRYLEKRVRPYSYIYKIHVNLHSLPNHQLKRVCFRSTSCPTIFKKVYRVEKRPTEFISLEGLIFGLIIHFFKVMVMS